MGRQGRDSPEVRERAVRTVFEQEPHHESQCATICSISTKIGCTAETPRKWVRQAERDQGGHAGLTTNDRERVKKPEREHRELKRANEILARRRRFRPGGACQRNPSLRSTRAQRDECLRPEIARRENFDGCGVKRRHASRTRHSRRRCDMMDRQHEWNTNSQAGQPAFGELDPYSGKLACAVLRRVWGR